MLCYLQDVSIQWNGDHKQSKKEMTSNTHIQYGQQKSIDASIRLTNNSKTRLSINGDASLTLPSRHIFISGDITQGSRKDYNVRATFEPNNKERSSVEANWRKVGDKSYQLDSTLNIYNQKPLLMRSAFDYGLQNLMAQGELRRGKDKYFFKGASTVKEGRGGKFDFEIQYPGSHLVLGLEGSRRKSKVRGKVEVDWDADNKSKNSHYFLLLGSGDVQDIDDFGGMITLQYPSRKIVANIKHKTGDRYITHADIEWTRRDKIVFDLTMRDIVEHDTRRLESDFEFSSPFEGYERLNVSLSHVMASNQYMSKSSILWGKKQKILSSLMVKRPISPKHFHVNGLLDTPYDALRHFVLKVNHDIDESLVSSVNTEIGEKRFQMHVNSSYPHVAERKDFLLNVDYKSNVPLLEKMLFSFVQTPRSFVTKLSNKIHGDEYLYVLRTNNQLNEWMKENTGSLLITVPKDTIRTTWSHSWRDQKLNTSLTSTWGERGHQKLLRADLNGNYRTSPLRKVDFKANLDIPAKKLKQLGFSLNHEYRIGYIHTAWAVETNRQTTSSLNMNYQRGDGDVNFALTSSNLDRDDIVLRLSSEYGNQPYRGDVELKWSPYHRAELEGSLRFTDEQELDGNLRFSSPIRGYEKVILTVGHKREGLGWNAETNLNLGHHQTIDLRVRYRIEGERMLRWTLTTPYTQVSRMEGGYTLDITKSGFSYKSDFEMKPMVGRYDAVVDLSGVGHERNQDINFKFRINTPKKWIPYIKGQYLLKFRVTERTEHWIQVEYVPTKVINMKTTYSNYIDNHLEGSVLFESPFTDTFDASFNHDGDLQKFDTRVEVSQVSQGHVKAYIVDIDFALEPKVIGKFSMTTPMKGYEHVFLGFTQEGNSRSVDTSVEYNTNGDKIYLETGFSVAEPYRGKLLVKTPFSAVKIAKVSYLHRGTFLDFHNEAQVTYNQNNFEYDATFRHEESGTSGLLVVKTPFKGFTENRLSGSRTGTVKRFTVNGQLQFDQSKRFTFELQNTLENINHLDSRMSLTTPFTEDLEYHFTYTHEDGSLSYLLDAQMGVDNSIHYKYDYTLNTELYQLDISYQHRLVISGRESSSGYSIHHLGSLTNFENIIKSTSDRKTLSSNVAFSLHKREGQDMPVWALWRNAAGHVHIQTPFQQFENGKIYFSYAGHESGLESNVELMYNSQKLSGSVDITLKPNMVITINAETPFSGYEDMSASAHYTKGSEVHKVKVIVSYARGETITVTSVLNMESSTMSGNIRIATPFHDFQTMEIELTHKGNDLMNIHSTVSVTSSQFAPLQGELSVRYSSPSNLDVTVKILSSIKGFKNFIGTIKNTKQNKKHLSRIEVNLNESDQIVVACSWEYEDGRAERSLTSQITVTTPFDNFREGSIKLDHADSKGLCRNTILVEYNEKTYVDVDASYTKTDHHTATLRFREPRPMDFEMTGTKNNGNYQGDMNLNWNKLENGNTLRLEASASDNSKTYTVSKALSFKVIHPRQTVGVQGSFKGSSSDFTSQGAVSWSQDEEKSASYDLKWTDKSRRQWPSYDTMLKLDIPSRSIEMSGSYDEKYKTKLFNGTVLWDAENDREKQVGMAVSYRPGTNKEAIVQVKLPKIDKVRYFIA